jgi:hypothetical protein
MNDPGLHHEADHVQDAETVEAEGLNAHAIGIIVVGGFIFIIAAMFVAVQITGIVFQDALVESTTVTGYPVLEETTTQAEEILSTYAPIDRNAGIYRIPIDRAMELIVEEAQMSGASAEEE